MYSQEVQIQNETGMHARPAQLLVQTAGKYRSRITIRNENGAEADAKSILGLMSMALTKGTKVTIEAEGPDEKEAVEALAELINSKFGEE